MLLRFSCTTFLGLAAVVGTDAFVAPRLGGPRQTSLAVGGWENDDFLNALKVGGSSEEEESEVGSESERFKALREAARKAQQEAAIRPVAIDNPFLTPPPPVVQPPPNLEALSVEEQARLFREMMQQQQSGVSAPVAEVIPAAPRVPKTDRAGRPQGRNRDADQIANSADVYFAQLKRDSTVRTLARIRGEEEKAEKVFEDEGIKQLSTLLQTNPYLKAQREEEAKLIDTVPEEVLKPYFEDEKEDEERLSSPGLKWKDLLSKKKTKGNIGNTAPAEAVVSKPSEPQTAQSAPEPAVPPQPEPVVVSQPEPKPVTPLQPEPVAISQPEPEPVTLLQPEPIATIQPEPIAPPQQQPTPVAPQPVAQQVASVVPPTQSTTDVSEKAEASSRRVAEVLASTPAETRQKIRTLMGLILKHRGGPGFGTGRLKGPEIERFEKLLNEVTEDLRSEAMSTTAAQVASTPLTQVVQAPPVAPAPPVAQIASTPVAVPPASPPSVVSDFSRVDGIIACIEGANTMFKNSPPELKPSIVVTLRAALMAAVGTCNSILGDEITFPPTAVAGEMSQIDTTMACIEGAITMYKNSPPELRQSVLLTLRIALMSAVNTCDAVSSPGQVAPAVAVPQQPQSVTQPPPQAQPPAAAVAAATHTPLQVRGTDPNSKKLEGIYEILKAAEGDGPLGLRSDLTPGEAAELEEKLMEMRGILMEELDSGIPDPEPEESSGGSTENSTVSKYQQMLAKAKASAV